MKIIVTGGAGFIGSAVVRHLIGKTQHDVLVVDKLTYAGNLASLKSVEGHSRYCLSRTDICDRPAMDKLLAAFDADAVIHLAAESHVDRSIDSSADFIKTNIVGTYTLLEAALAHWRRRMEHNGAFRFHHVSTDEVFGALGDNGRFTEETRYDPRSPYSASKAASDHLVRAWGHTFGLPVVLSNCSNNYGPYQFVEKLIPLTILKCLAGEPIPVYGRGVNVRDWLFVQDHAEALTLVLEKGKLAQTYNIGGEAERRNIDVVNAICNAVDKLAPRAGNRSYRELITFVTDRPAHDFRYAIDCAKIKAELSWAPRHSFETGLAKTVLWYLDNRAWWEPLIASGDAISRRGLQNVHE